MSEIGSMYASLTVLKVHDLIFMRVDTPLGQESNPTLRVRRLILRDIRICRSHTRNIEYFHLPCPRDRDTVCYRPRTAYKPQRSNRASESLPMVPTGCVYPKAQAGDRSYSRSLWLQFGHVRPYNLSFCKANIYRDIRDRISGDSQGT